MRGSRDEAGPLEAVDQSGDVASAHAQRLRQVALRRRPTVGELPQQVRPGWGQTPLLQRSRHVLVDEDRELEHLIQQRYEGRDGHVLSYITM
jgi:hypothetical protein